jgi:hypothetical protein
LTLLFVSACGVAGFGFRTIEGSGVIVSEKRNVSDFDGVEVCCGMHLYLIQGDQESLLVTADDNLMDEIETRVIGNRLVVEYRLKNNVSYRPSEPIHLELTVVDIDAVSISGGGWIESPAIEADSFDLDLSGGGDGYIAELTADRVDIHISGGGDVEADTVNVKNLNVNLSGGSDATIDDLVAETLNLEVSGSGRADISGSVADQDINLSGGSDYEAGDLESKYATINSSGGGDSIVWVVEKLDVDISGGGNLEYYGNPQIYSSTSGGSNVTSLGEHE